METLLTVYSLYTTQMTFHDVVLHVKYVKLKYRKVSLLITQLLAKIKHAQTQQVLIVNSILFHKRKFAGKFRQHALIVKTILFHKRKLLTAGKFRSVKRESYFQVFGRK